MPEIAAAVVGAGRLGAFHADKYLASSGLRLKYVVDTDRARAERVAAAAGATILSDYRELAGKVDLVSVATPSLTHFRITADLLTAGIDVLVEKPMTATLDEARELAAIAERSGRILQVGHLERFNPAIVRLRSILRAPRFVECHRLAPFTERGTDVDVIFDLMTHDLDVILSLCTSEITSVEAIGVAVLTDRIDVANARLRFADGMIANLNSSRVAARRERKIRFFQPDAYISVDYEARTLQVYRKSPPAEGSQYPVISAERVELENSDPLRDEIASFVASVRDRTTPAVSARDGLRVIELCERIKTAMDSIASI
ncbi:MAG TPA: Gfo/Idh/MocA family oxidoreductase [Candidatus Binataceae bacterium]|nr:Gfo/Idh/MocA family oxidoreductase [Candidatus Binataceae bacterium]